MGRERALDNLDRGDVTSNFRNFNLVRHSDLRALQDGF